MATTHRGLIRWPTDDELWKHRDRTWRQWETILGAGKDTMKSHARRHLKAWKRKAWKRIGGRLSHAPCKGCGESMGVEELSHARECGNCRDPVRDPVPQGVRGVEGAGTAEEECVRETVFTDLRLHLAEVEGALRSETRRRRFMQVYGRYLSWGPVDGEPWVFFTDPSGDGPYREVKLGIPQGNDPYAAEARLIDMAIERIEGGAAGAGSQAVRPKGLTAAE